MIEKKRLTVIAIIILLMSGAVAAAYISKARIDILALLSAVIVAEFQYVKKRLKLSDGNLSSHLTVLEQAGCVKITKTFIKKNQRPTSGSPPRGKKRFSAIWMS